MTLPNTVDNSTLKLLAKKLESARQPLVITHYDPDGDAIGSALGLALLLEKKKNTRIKALIPNEDPRFLQWLPGHDRILVFDKNSEACRLAIEESDLFFLVDFNTTERLKAMKKFIDASRAECILIDHHPSPSVSCAVTISNVSASSTSELIYMVIDQIGDAGLIDADIAVNLFTGIMTDTGCFSYNSSNPVTYQIVASLLQHPMNKDLVYQRIYDLYTEQRMRLMGYCLHEKMTILPDYKTAYIALSREELRRFGYSPGDTEGFVNLPFSIHGIRVTALFTEKEDCIKISFRSQGSFPVNKFAEKYFSGGGHHNAAGGESKDSLEGAIQYFVKMISNHTDELDNDDKNP